MFGKALVNDMITRSSETAHDRRTMLRGAGLLGLGALGATALGTAGASAANAADAPSDATVLNFALNLEYLEAEFYSYAAFGHGLTQSMADGNGTMGGVSGGRKVLFKNRAVRQYAEEIAKDELAHVAFLRSALGGAKVSRPAIDLKASFTAAAVAAGIIKQGQTFDPFADDTSFLLGAFIFEDVGVTAYKGAAPLITNKTYLEAAAGILAVEAYHAGIVRSALFEMGTDVQGVAQKISDVRDAVDGSTDLDQGLTPDGGATANIVPTDDNGIAFSRTPQQVLNIVYLNGASGVSGGGFYPQGLNGDLRTT
ncbi:ferritin-like domain-containing protein [Quadrisphaera oryzae]|uniref:ferritin-like domain-containing protein n=1 Tax=Quadrisphaera TaxID=317661 RepID=UPI0016465371|nr:ferritin-like domain-containing protein [Quadrisphaera sp. RL12-1S]MBC3760097.1 ferritin-like domain-containing protein [Quadrisphaera sp. RL12-1S]